MNHQFDIENLFRKFSEGTLSPREAEAFFRIIREGDHNDLLQNILSDYWLQAETTDVEVPSDEILERLRAKINATGGGGDEVPVRRTINAPLYAFVKYAAVILITFGAGWMMKGFLSEPKPIAVCKSVVPERFSEITVAYGSKSRITLPDGSTVNLNAGSTLRYPSNFNKEKRNVYMRGEAYFEVQKDPRHPFLVRTDGVTVRVMGTKFNVKAYPDEKRVETTLVTGVVELYSNKQKIKEQNRLLVLKPNQQAICEINKAKGDSIETLSLNTNVDVLPVISWKDNKLMFRDEKFGDLVQKLERWYNVEIEISDKGLMRTTLSGVFVKESVEQSLNALKLAVPFKYRMEKNHIVISHK